VMPAPSQMFFDTAVYLTFVADCRAAGITAPIMPGLMVIQSYAGFKRMTAFCRSRVPAWIWETLNAAKVGRAGAAPSAPSRVIAELQAVPPPPTAALRCRGCRMRTRR
jgi:5,10-methylenetetrahydrofolate reductase